MKLIDIQRDKPLKEDRSVALSIRTSKAKSKYMKENNISPTKVFNTALEEMMKERQKHKTCENGYSSKRGKK